MKTLIRSIAISMQESSERYGVTPSQEKNDGCSAWKPARASSSPSTWRSKSTGTKATVGGTAMASCRSWPRFQPWVDGWSTSKTRSLGNGFR